MRITDFSIAQKMLYQLGNSTSSLAQSYQELSSGQKLTNPSDNPSEVSSVMSYESDLRRNVQNTSNLTRAQEISTVTYSNVSSLKDLLVRAEELAAKTSSLSSSDVYTANEAELNGLIEQAIQIGNIKQNGQYIFSGDATATTPFTATRDTSGNVTTVDYDGSTSSSSFPVADGVSISPYSSSTQNNQISTLINDLIALRDALHAKDSAAVSTANTALLSDEDNIINQMSAHANVQARVELIQNQVKGSSTATYNTIASKSETDIAQATVRYNMMQNAYQAAIAAGGKMMQTSLLNYLN